MARKGIVIEKVRMYLNLFTKTHDYEKAAKN
jgi:hypothetical protein